MKVWFKESAIRAKNAAVARAVGQTNVKKISLPLFTDIEAVSWATQRVLAELSYPLARVALTVNRKAFRLCPGDLFVLNYSPYGIRNMVLRVISIEEEGLSSERLKVKAIQDIEYAAGIPSVTGAEGQAEQPDFQVVPLTHVQVEEPPYVIGETPNTIVPVAAREKGTETGALVFGSVDGGDSYRRVGDISTFSVHGELTSDLTPSGTSFTVDIPVDANYLSALTWPLLEKANRLLIGSEVICFENITPVEGTESEYEISGLHRGLFDTAAQDHPVGSDMYSLDGLDIITWPALQPGGDYYFKIVPFNGCNVGSLSDATAIQLHFRNRSLCPRSVINLKANGASSGATYTDDVVLTWDPRVRWNDDLPTALEYCDGLFKVEAHAGDSNPITDESFTSAYDTPVPLAHQKIISGSVVVTTTDGNTTYVEGTDYAMDYPAGTITVLSSGSMADGAEYYIDYNYTASFSLVRTAVTNKDDPFFNTWTYTQAMNGEDNGGLAGYLLFKVYDFIDNMRISNPTEIEVRKE